MAETQYTEDNIRSLDWKEHIRMRPGMYIGKLGDGSSPDDGIYILLKEVIDNCIDEFVMGARLEHAAEHREGPREFRVFERRNGENGLQQRRVVGQLHLGRWCGGEGEAPA